MKYVLDNRYLLRSWKDRLGGVVDTKRRDICFLGKESYYLLLKCDGAHEIDVETLPEDLRAFLRDFENKGVIRQAGFLDYIRPEQSHRRYPAAFKASAHWSITGACNLKCRHCFMSAPHAKHGVPTHEQIMDIADQLVECGVFEVDLTGGEPLTREDFLDVVGALSQRGISVGIIFTNGWLVDEKLLDELDTRGQHPEFQLSFDGVGAHDFLRGVPGAEEKTLGALRLLHERGYATSASMCIHRKNRGALRDSVKLLASYGVGDLKVGSMMQLGEWASPDVRDLQLSHQEVLEAIEEYIPRYFEDGAPLSIALAGAFAYAPGDERWCIHYRTECSAEQEKNVPSCGVLLTNFYIGPDGMVAPCMGMCDCGYAVNFPNLFRTPLRDIISPDSDFNRLCKTTVGEIRDHNGTCRACEFVDRCSGGCRNSVLIQGDDYYAPDEEYCYFFKNGWEKRITVAAEDAFRDYMSQTASVEER